MNNIAVSIPVVLAISIILLKLLSSRKDSSQISAGTDAPTIPARSIIDDGLSAPKHFQHFRQIRQALSTCDAEYLLRTAPKSVAKQALRERRAVARRFLKGLHEDFSNLSKLGRVIASLSPEISNRQEAERLKLTLKFQFLYAVIWMRLYTGNLPVEQVERLTAVVSRLSARMDEAMAEISTQSSRNMAETLGG
jgi:hypothetical protein